MAEEHPDYVADSLLRVGPEKPLGYLPLQTLTDLCGWSLEAIITWAQDRELKTRVDDEATCNVHTGAVTIWDADAVQDLLDANRDIVERAGWPMDERKFVQRVMQEFAQDPALAELIGVLFADPRFIEPQYVTLLSPAETA